jgi:hypothetical protein
MGRNPAAGEANLRANFIIRGNQVSFFKDDGTNFTTAATTLAVTPSEPPAYITMGTDTYITVVGDKSYRLNHSAATVTAQATPNSPGLRCLTMYGLRAVAGGPGGKAPDGTAAPQNRVYFTDPRTSAAPYTWPAANFFDVGEASNGVTALIPQRTHLLIAMSDGSWWLLTGVPGTDTAVLRPLLQSVSPFFPNHAAQLGNGLVGYVIGSSTDNGSVPSLGYCSGSAVQLVPHIMFGDGRRQPPLPTYQVVPLKEKDDWFVQGGPGVAANQMALYQRGAWTLHQWQVAGVTLRGFVNSQTVADTHLFTDGSGRFFQWRAYNNRPAFVSDGLMQPGDASTTPFTAGFTLPEWYAADGGELSVVEVTVDFKAWNTGSPATNHFDLKLTTLRLYEDGSVTVQQSWDEAGSASSTSGTVKRKRFAFSGAAAEGNGFQIGFDNMRGVAIQKVTAHIELKGARF